MYHWPRFRTDSLSSIQKSYKTVKKAQNKHPQAPTHTDPSHRPSLLSLNKSLITLHPKRSIILNQLRNTPYKTPTFLRLAIDETTVGLLNRVGDATIFVKLISIEADDGWEMVDVTGEVCQGDVLLGTETAEGCLDVVEPREVGSAVGGRGAGLCYMGIVWLVKGCLCG